ncbi:MAG: sulfurtransferase TusA family protein [Rubritepida sp.]|jgi:TusA-related sulfurtransferase|nr:sulfurtransferase TusA family protein [Rubritepida sp.]
MEAQGRKLDMASNAPDAVLDVSRELCPMTFVRTRLRLDQLGPGAVLEVRFRGAEPRENLPRSLRELGHELLVLAEGPEAGAGWLRVRKR